jgi:gamma-glutamyltranspeptidase/glutathione hydrolase
MNFLGVGRSPRIRFLITTVAFVPLAAACSGPAFARSAVEHPVLIASAVAVADKYGADAAQHIFDEGGNAVDAAVAIAFSLAVTYPEAGNIGGGGFMTLYVKGKPYFLDYRERAPESATRNMYLDDKGDVIKGSSLVGVRAAGVPGTVEGMWEAQQRFGRLKWKQVLAPAIRYAQDGFEVDKRLVKRRDQATEEFGGRTNFGAYFGSLQPGATFRQPELASTLIRIANEGAKGFYGGKTAGLIAASMKNDGLITTQDLRDYKAVWRTPVQADWDGFQVITAPPPSSGGIGLVQLLKMKADLKAEFEHVPLNSAQYVHLNAEIEKRVFADRAQYLGDPDFYKVPVAQLIDDTYLANRAAEIDPDKPSDTASVMPGMGNAMPEKMETTHFSVVDKWGNAVSNTYTLNGFFGSGVVVDGTGILLNDEMDDFSAKPGVPNQFGAVGSDANSIEPRKRPLSTMTPTILTKDNKVALVIGTPGGTTILTSVFQVISNLYDFHMPLDEAVAATRFHHQLLPANMIFWEPYKPLQASVAKQLEAMGYVLKSRPFSEVQAIKVDGNVPDALADPRGRGVARVIR